MQCVSFSVLGELHLRTNFAECREIEGLRLRDSNNYRFGKKEKKTNKFFKIFSIFVFANNFLILIIEMSNQEAEKDIENSDEADVSETHRETNSDRGCMSSLSSLGVPGGAMASPDSGRSVNPISIKEADYIY